VLAQGLGLEYGESGVQMNDYQVLTWLVSLGFIVGRGESVSHFSKICIFVCKKYTL
jgi:hypothetical protein